MVGLGAGGLAAVARLLERGRSVVGVDAGPVAGGASGRNGGFLLAGAARFHHRLAAERGREVASAVQQLTQAELDRLASAHPDLVRVTGSLRIATSDAELDDCRTQLAAMRAERFAVEPYEGPEGRGLLFPRDGSYEPAALCAREAAAVLTAGAQLHQHTRVVEIRPRRVVTDRGVVACGAVVVAVDGGLEQLVPSLTPRVRTARAQMLATAPVAPRFPRPVYARHGYDYWQQLPDGRIVLGGCRDRAGASEWVHDPRPTAPVQAMLDGLLAGLGVDAPITHRWAGSIAFTSSGLPVLEPVADGVVACGAYSGTGNLLARLAGRVAADLVLDGGAPLADLLRRGA